MARARAYAALLLRELQAHRALCHPGSAPVALWVTNRERMRRIVERQLLPARGCACVLRRMRRMRDAAGADTHGTCAECGVR